LGLACSSTAEDDLQEAGLGAGFDDGDGDDGRGDPNGDDGAGEDDAGGTGGGWPSPGADTDGTDAGDDPAGTSDLAPPCPDPLPPGWIFCEDFETLADPSEAFFEYADAGGAFMIVDGVGASGTRSMQAKYQYGAESAGLLLVSFGDSPIDHGLRPSFSPQERFDEIYWRVRVRMQPDWPDQGPGRLTRAMAFAGQDWSEAFVAHIRSAGSDTMLEAVPQTCITDASVKCAGYDDQVGLESLGGLLGQSEVFSQAAAGRWHCVEVHMRVNTLGESDGVLEFWVDGNYENGRDDLDWRGSWDLYGINAVVVENSWTGGAPASLRRWIDDIAIATERVGCD
jgi:hypothetical protein